MNREPGAFLALLLLSLLFASPVAANPESARLRAQAFAHLYNLDYEEATGDMEAAVKADPHDISAERGLAVIPWLVANFRRGTLTVDEYLGSVTRASVATDPAPPEVASRFYDHVARATRLAEAAIAERPKDPDGHYQLGSAVGLQASYIATVEGRLLGAFRLARRAYDEHERVLALAPARHDAELVVGTYRYLVSALSLPMRVLAYVAGFGGGKERGIQMMEHAAAFPGEAQPEALVALVLVYNRESRWDAAMRVIADLQRTFPRNRILWLEAGATALRAGRASEADVILTEGLARLAKDPRPRMFGEEAMWYWKRGTARVALNRLRDGEEDLRRVLKLEARSWVRQQAQLELDKITRRPK